MVAYRKFLFLAIQSMKTKAFLSLKGSERSVSFSAWHFANMALADLYVLQVLLVMARFPYFAIESAISAGSSRFDNSSAVQPPLVPYFVSPVTGVGWNLAVPARDIISYLCAVLGYRCL
jgi:hypothetical protein